MRSRASLILVLMLMIAGAAAGICFARMRSQQAAADAAAGDLREAVKLIGEMKESGKGSGRIAAGRLDGADLNRRIREAASGAGISDRLASVEPNRPVRLGESDYNELMVFLRFENVNLRQLAGFMHRLSASDTTCRIKTIELETPAEGAVAGGSGEERWIGDITLSYLSYVPREDRQ